LDRYGRFEIKTAAAELGCSTGTIRNYVRDHAELGARYTGAWSGLKPWTFSKRDLERMRQLLVENQQAGIEKTRAKWRAGEIVRTRSGVTVDCACGCGRAVYRSPSQLKSKSGCYFYSRSCAIRYRWSDVPSIARKLIAEEWWGGRARQRWKGRWGGRSAGHLGWRPRVSVTEEQKNEIVRLRALGWGRRAIARRVLVGEHAVRLTLAELDGT